MDKPFLPKTLTFYDAIIELKLVGDDFPYSRAVNYLLKYAQDGLKIHFRADIAGYDIKKPITKTKEFAVGTDELMIKEKVSYCEYSDDELIFKYGSYKAGQEQPYLVSVFRFQCDAVEYYSVDETEQFVRSANVEEGSFYVYRDDLKSFISHMKNKPSTDKSNIDNKAQFPVNADYLDLNHENYSEELHAAIEAWLYASNENENKYGDSFKKRVEAYLKSKQFDLNGTAIKRLAIVANSNKNKRNKEK